MFRNRYVNLLFLVNSCIKASFTFNKLSRECETISIFTPQHFIDSFSGLTDFDQQSPVQRHRFHAHQQQKDHQASQVQVSSSVVECFRINYWVFFLIAGLILIWVFVKVVFLPNVENEMF